MNILRNFLHAVKSIWSSLFPRNFKNLDDFIVEMKKHTGSKIIISEELILPQPTDPEQVVDVDGIHCFNIKCFSKASTGNRFICQVLINTWHGTLFDDEKRSEVKKIETEMRLKGQNIVQKIKISLPEHVVVYLDTEGKEIDNHYYENLQGLEILTTDKE